jgi:hypothetical protein
MTLSRLARTIKAVILNQDSLTNLRSIEIYYEEEKTWSLPLNLLAQVYQTDKGGVRISGTSKHAYVDFYSILFSSRRDEFLSILECGLGSNNPTVPSNMGITGVPGASLRMWKYFFPNSQVFGFDIDSNIIFQEERITTFVGDQLNPTELKASLNKISTKFDLIIDDGLHSYESITKMMEACFDFLDTSGVYVVEDLDLDLVKRMRAFLKKFSIDNFHYFVSFRETNYRDQGGWLLIIQKT